MMCILCIRYLYTNILIFFVCFLLLTWNGRDESQGEDKWLMSGYHSHWHQSLHDTSFGRPIRAPEIRVCRIPNLISPQLFVALAASDVDVKIFENNLVACCIVL